MLDFFFLFLQKKFENNLMGKESLRTQCGELDAPAKYLKN